MTLNGHNARLNSAVWSSDGQRIITASWDETAKVWDANTGQELFTLTGHNGNVLSACWSPDQKRLMTSGQDGIVQIYTTDMDELLQIAESRVTRQLTAEEKEKYGVLDLN
jgi:WD40 repeat protein